MYEYKLHKASCVVRCVQCVCLRGVWYVLCHIMCAIQAVVIQLCVHTHTHTHTCMNNITSCAIRHMLSTVTVFIMHTSNGLEDVPEADHDPVEDCQHSLFVHDMMFYMT